MAHKSQRATESQEKKFQFDMQVFNYIITDYAFHIQEGLTSHNVNKVVI